jgi:coenzyme F420 hydrogenase subunit beta
MCSDALCELADISFGDAWLPELSADKIGSSIVVSRTGIGEELLQRAETENKLIIQHTSKEKLIESQKPALYFKKKSLSARKRILQFENRYLPSDNASLLSASTNDYFIALFIMYLNNYISSTQINRKILKLIPLRLMMFYQFGFYTIIKYTKLE